MSTPGPVLVLDNYDSFTYNIVQALRQLGADVVVKRNDAVSVAAAREMGLRGLVVSPGPCTPQEAGVSLEFVRELGRSVPTLGVCLGHQVIGAAYGARVVRAARLAHGKTSLVENDGTGVFKDLPRSFEATRYHSLVVEAAPPELIVNAWTTDPGVGTPVIMGFRHVEYPVWGVQFHPESVLTAHGPEMFANFLAFADRRAEVLSA